MENVEELIRSYEKEIKDLKELLELSKSLNSSLEYSLLLDSLLFACMGHAKVTKAGLFIKSEISSKEYTLYRNYEGFNTQDNFRYAVKDDSELVEVLKNKPGCYTMPELLSAVNRVADIKPFTILEPTLLIPIINKNNLYGIIVLGERIEKAPFTESEKTFLRNIADLAAVAIYNAVLFEASTTDMMTKLKLRHILFQILEKDFSSQERQPLTLLMIDIDKFKNVNDTYGHAFGDIVIKKVTSEIRGSIRMIDLGARYGGEEFTVVLHSIRWKEGQEIAERIRKKVESISFNHEGSPVSVTISIGVAEYLPGVDVKPVDLIKRADAALYTAKKGGRNRVVVNKI